MSQSALLRRKTYWEKKAMVAKLKEAPCMDCGNTYPPYVMDFDHRDPLLKCANISTMYQGSTKAILAEIAKCDLVCSNCHRIRSYKAGHYGAAETGYFVAKRRLKAS